MSEKTPLDRITDLEEKVGEIEQVANKPQTRDVGQRMLALVTIALLMIATTLLGALKILTVEVIAAILGAVAGRLTSNIGGNETQSGASK